MFFVLLVVYVVSIVVVVVEFQLQRRADTAATFEWLESSEVTEALEAPDFSTRRESSDRGQTESMPRSPVEESRSDGVVIGPGTKVSVTPASR